MASQDADVRQPLLLEAGEDHAQEEAHDSVVLGSSASEAQGVSRPTTPEEVEAAVQAEANASSQAFRSQLYGLLLYGLSTIFGTGMSLFAKVAGRHGVGVFEVVLFRSLTLIAFTTPELVYIRLNPFADSRRWLYIMRGALGFCSTSSLYLAVTLLPMADAAVLAFLSPVWVALLSPLILRERPSRAVFLAIPFCMVGVILTARPSFIFGGSVKSISAVGIIVGLAQALFNAAARMSVRAISLGGKESMAAIIFSMGLVSALLSLAAMAVPGQGFVKPQDTLTWLALAGNGIMGYGNQVLLTAGLQRASAAPAVALNYLSVVWGLLADMLIFGDWPTALSILGAVVVCLSSFFVAFGERSKRNKEKAALRLKASQMRLAQNASASDLEEMRGSEDRPLLLPQEQRLRSPSGRVHGSATSLIGA